MDKIFQTPEGSLDRFRSKLDKTEKNHKGERAFLVGTSALFVAGLALAILLPTIRSEELPKHDVVKTELLPMKSTNGTRIFWVF